MSKMIDDLSFSGIVGNIQGDKKKAKKLLIEIAKRELAIIETEGELTLLLNNLSVERRVLYGGIENIMDHLKVDRPLTVVNGDEVIIFDEDIRIEKNVI